MVWPHGGSPADVVASIEERLHRYPDPTKKVVVFDKIKYNDVSAKDH